DSVLWQSSGSLYFPGSGVWTAGGNVGIGTTTPIVALDVEGNLRVTNLDEGETDAVITHLSGLFQSRVIDSRVWGVSLVDGLSLIPNYLVKVFDSNTLGNSLIYDNGANIGIGNTDPKFTLDINGSLNVATTAEIGSLKLTGALIDKNSDAGVSGQVLASTGDGVDWIDISSGGIEGTGTINYIPIWSSTSSLGDSVLWQSSGSLYFPGSGVWTAGGNVGIGTTMPDSRLNVAGNLKVREEVIYSQGFEDNTFPPSLEWSTGGSANWSRDSGVKYEGSASAKSGAITHGQSTWLDLNYTFPENGSISFYWKVSSEEDYDFLVFCVDNDSCTIEEGYRERISGEVDWVEVTVNVLAGLHSFRWIYGKDSSASEGEDTGWVDNIRLKSGGLYVLNVGSYFLGGNVGIGTTNPTKKLEVYDGELYVDHPSSLKLASYYDGDAYDVYVSGKYVYLLNGYTDELEILDISDPFNPFLIGSYSLPTNGKGISVNGRYAYVAVGNYGLYIIDISDPSSPSFVASYDTSGSSYDVYVSGRYAYVADGTSGLNVIDVSNQNNPVLIGAYNTDGRAFSVYVSGKYAYIADDYGGFDVVDISDPANPFLVGSYTTSGYATDVYVSGRYAYVADDYGGLVILDISDPSSPNYVASYEVDNYYAYGVYVSGKYAYVAYENLGLVVLDVSDPSHPTLVGNYNANCIIASSSCLDGIHPTYARKVYVSGKYAYMADGFYGLMVIDLMGANIYVADIGNIQSQNINIVNDVDIGNNLFIRNSLNVGPGGILSGGSLGVGVSSSVSAMRIIQSGSGNVLDLFSGSNNLFTVKSIGNVGIGITNPDAKLDVNGRIKMRNWVADGTTVVYKNDNGDIGVISSDLRLKKDISPLTNVLDMVLQLNPYRYRSLNSSEESNYRLGLIAQEVMPVMPELTFKFTDFNSGEEYYSVHYDQLPVLLLAAIKEQQTEIALLENRLDLMVETASGSGFLAQLAQNWPI
ncbi:MAG: tail fiber domain-containing protein, partial [Candidatus Nanoarchaeia archaeon]|nr:tail fiber domain-containing protein [Candidatus Jingweiarchaeum tengchongense]